MNVKLILALLATSLIMGAVPAGAVNPLNWNEMPWDSIHCSDAPEEGKDMFHSFVDPLDPRLTVVVHTMCLVDSPLDSDRGTDCPSHAFVDLGYFWTSAVSFQIDASGSGLTNAQVLNAIDASGNTWDVETAADIYGASVIAGNGGSAGRQDGVNQIGWKRLAATTIAQTTTWYFTSSGQAVESDAAYNSRFSWGVNGESNRMDVQNIATHEIGHTYGLGHPPSNSANACLTMYATGSAGETSKRTLGDGDIHGIEAIYGA